MRLLFSLVLAPIALVCSSLSALSADAPRTAETPIAIHAWCFNQGTLFEAMEKTKAAGADAMEVFLMGMKLSPGLPDVVFDETLSDEHLALVKAKERATGVRILNAYIGSKQWTRIEQDEAELRKIFAFGKKLGVVGFTGEPAERQWDMVEKLSKEFDVSFAIHNHIRGFEAPYLGGEYRYWDPGYTFAKLEEQMRDTRFGICFDTGHFLRSGGDALATLKTIGSRVRSVHLKDVVAADPDGHDCVFGTGIFDVRGLLAELERRRFHGHLAMEYEWFRSPTFERDIAQCVAFVWQNRAAPAQ